MRWIRLGCLLAGFGAILAAAEIEGVVIVKRKLTPRSVTATAGAYSRGTAVALRSEPAADPLEYEHTHVVVYLEDADLSSHPVTAVLEQRGRQFEEDLLVVPAGSTVSFPNRDAIFHNIFSFSRAKTFDLGNYPKDEARSVRFPTPGLVLVGCHLHPNMGAAIMVTPNHWAMRADRSGRFRLADVPAGRRTVVAWHKTAGYFRETVELSEGQKATIQFFVPLEAEKD
jgi:plastocyanin